MELYKRAYVSRICQFDVVGLTLAHDTAYTWRAMDLLSVVVLCNPIAANENRLWPAVWQAEAGLTNVSPVGSVGMNDLSRIFSPEDL